MDLQNIAIDSINEKVTSYYTIPEEDEGVVYSIPVVTNLAALQVELDAEAGFVVDESIVQYTEDQYGAGEAPRIFLKDNNDDPDLVQVTVVNLIDISAGLNTQLGITRVEVETEIAIQIG